MRNGTMIHRLTSLFVALALCHSADAQVCPNADVYESNGHACSTTPPNLAPLGLTTDLTIGVGLSAHDYWHYVVAPGETVTFDVLFTHANGDIDLRLYNHPCSVTQAMSQSTTDDEQVSYTNASGAPFAVNLMVRFAPGPTPACQDYSLLVTSIFDPCLAGSDDAYAPNHDCNSAVPLTPGTYTDLITYKSTAEDFFAIDVPSGETLNVDVLFTDADGDIDVYLYEVSTLGSTCGDKFDYLEVGFSTSDDESISWTNNYMWTLTYYVQINLWNSPSNADCNTYDLVIDIDPSDEPTPMCFGDGTTGPCPCGNHSTLGAGEGCRSSLGYGSILAHTGSTSVGANDLGFTVTQARPNQTGLLVQGASLTAVPFKDGILCAGNPTERIEVIFTNGLGVGSTLTSIVIGGAVNPGDTRYYQMWSRDPGGFSPCGEGSNFSNGMKVIFTP